MAPLVKMIDINGWGAMQAPDGTMYFPCGDGRYFKGDPKSISLIMSNWRLYDKPCVCHIIFQTCEACAVRTAMEECASDADTYDRETQESFWASKVRTHDPDAHTIRHVIPPVPPRMQREFDLGMKYGKALGHATNLSPLPYHLLILGRRYE